MNGGSAVYRHLDGTECLHRLARDSEAPVGVYCTVAHSDVLLDDGGPPPLRQRHRSERPGMFDSWPHALWTFGMWAVFSGLILGGLIGLAWALLHA